MGWCSRVSANTDVIRPVAGISKEFWRIKHAGVSFDLRTILVIEGARADTAKLLPDGAVCVCLGPQRTDRNPPASRLPHNRRGARKLVTSRIGDRLFDK